MNLDIPILVGSILAILLSLIWSRATTVGPIIFAWAGAAAGGTLAFIGHYNPASDQVGIEFIVPFAFLGAMCGLLPGFALRSAYLRGDSSRQGALEVIAGAFLFAGLGLIVGWIANRREDDLVFGILTYSVTFAAVGAGLAYLNWQLQRVS